MEIKVNLFAPFSIVNYSSLLLTTVVTFSCFQISTVYVNFTSRPNRENTLNKQIQTQRP